MDIPKMNPQGWKAKIELKEGIDKACQLFLEIDKKFKEDIMNFKRP